MRRLFSGFFLSIFVLAVASTASAEFYTIRVLNRSGRPYSSNRLEFTPDGEKLLLSSGKGTMLLAVDGCQVLHEKKIAPFTIAFSRDSSQVLMASTRYTQAMNLATGAIANIRWQLPPGKLGIVLEEQAGKLLIKSITPGSPAEGAGITLGSELLVVHEFGSRQSVLGRGVEKTIKLLQGPAGTSIGLTVIPRGKRREKRFNLVRRRGETNGSTVRFFPERPHRAGAPSTIFSKNNYLVFLDAANGELNSIIATEEIKADGLKAISPDGKYFGAVGRRREKGETQFLVEVFDLATRKRLFATPYDDSYREVMFSSDSKDFLIGSHDSVYVLDLAETEFSKQLNLGWKPTLRTDVDDGSDTTEQGPTGWWLKQTSGRSPNPLLTSFDLGAEGVLAVGAPTGEVTLWSAATGEKIRQVAPPVGHKAEKVRISPDGKWIAYYVNGVLTLETIEPDSEDSENQ